MSEPDRPGTTMAGAARVAITPPLGIILSGFPVPDRRAEEIHDDLYASALVLGEGAARVALVSLDLTAIDAKTAARTRILIRERIGIEPDRIMLWATHTHSAPAVPVGPLFDEGVLNRLDEHYVEQLPASIARVVEAAANRAARASVGFALGCVDPPVGRNRRHNDGPFDPELPLLVVADMDGRPRAAIVSHSCHPTVLHAHSPAVTGDLAWGVREELADRLGEDTVLLYATGAAGDQSTRRSRRGTTFDEARRLGGLVADATAAGIEIARLADDPSRLRACTAPVTLPLRQLPDRATAERSFREAEAALEAAQADGTDRAAIRTAEVNLLGARHTARYAAIQEANPYPATATVEIQAIAIGDVHVLGLPVELFLELGQQIRARAPRPTLLVCYANDLAGYVVTPAAADEGGYEPNVTLLAPEAAEILVDSAVELLHRLDASG